MKKLFAIIAAVLALGLVAGPAVADDAGVVVLAQAVVGKTAGADDCSTNPSGGGLGLPVVNGVKKAFYRFTGTGTSVNEGAITLEVCGQVDSVANAVGGACGMSSGNNGRGRAGSATLSGVGWDASAATVFVVTGNAHTSKGTQALIGTVTASGTGASCATKAGSGDSKTGGAQVFNVSLTYVLTSAAQGIKHTK